MSSAAAIFVFLLAAAVIGVVGTRLTTLSDRLADRTGLGEAFVGAVFLGAATSLPGITASVAAAWEGRAEMALANAIGGIAAQTAFLAVADMAYRKANLEHAAVSVPNMIQASMLVVLLSLVILAVAAPEISFWSIHPVTPALFLVYLFGLRLARQTHELPMWFPRKTKVTRPDVPDEPQTPARADVWMWTRFSGAAATVVVAGYLVTRSISTLADTYAWLNDSIAGAVFTAVATSLPELVTSVAAVRRGALTLAVGGILGGNCFDTLFAAAADVAYRNGSLFHAATSTAAADSRALVLVAVSILMTAVLLLGLLRREESGPGGIGFESVTVLLAYAGTLALLALI